MGGTGNGENWVLLWWGRPKTSRANNFQIFKLDLEKAEEPEIKLPISPGSSRKTSISALLTTPKPSTVWITINYGKF